MNSENGANADNETAEESAQETDTDQNIENGGNDDNTGTQTSPDKMGEIPLTPDRDNEMKEEADSLRRMTAKLAKSVSSALKKKGEWSSKDIDMFIANWVKIVGVQVKLNGGADSFERILSELADRDGIPPLTES